LLAVLLLLAAYAATDPFSLALSVVYSIVGAILVIRRPRNPIGWLLIGIAFGFTGTTPPPSLDLARLAAGTATWDQLLLAWVAGWSGSLSICCYLALSQVFPSGRLPDGRWPRRLAATLLVATAAVLALTAFGRTLSVPTGGEEGLVIPNHLGLLSWIPMADLIPPGLLFGPLLLLLFIGMLAMLVRYRRSTGLLRLQLRWLVAGVSFVALAVLFGLVTIAVFGDGIGFLAWLPALIAYPSVPAAVAVAVLRYRLYEIDRIISRTISWAMVSAGLIGAFVAAVLALQALLSGLTQGATLAVAASTLLAFALFQPLRRRVQAAVDQRFNRARYDAEQTVDAFAQRLRAETDIHRVRSDLSSTAASAVAPASLWIWLR
jgi:hypothetical protein